MTSIASDLILGELEHCNEAGLTAAELADRVRRHPGNVRRVLGQLEDAGLVRRTAWSGRHVVWSRSDKPIPVPPPKRAVVEIWKPDYELVTELAAREGRSEVAVINAALQRYRDAQYGGAPIAS